MEEALLLYNFRIHYTKCDITTIILPTITNCPTLLIFLFFFPGLVCFPRLSGLLLFLLWSLEVLP